MSQIASKNLYDLLGNDPEADPDREPEPPTKAVDKPVQRTGKRNAGPEAPAAAASAPRAAGGRGGRQGQFGRGEEAVNNRADDGARQDRRPREPREGGYRGRGTRGGPRGSGGRTFRSGRDDRQSHSGIGEHEKQAAHGWGKEGDGNAELTDERAGEAIADAEVKNDSGFTPDTAGADPAFTNGPDGETNAEAVAEPEDNTKSYDQYLAEQAEKRLALGSSLEFRKANEGSKQKFPEGSAFSRTEENYFAGGPGKARREKNQKAKELVTIDGNYYAAPDAGDRGGRGGARGGRGGRGGRGDFRGGERGARGSGRGRGESRGGARGDFRGDFRGGAPRAERGGPRGGFNAADSSAFPALGGS